MNSFSLLKKLKINFLSDRQETLRGRKVVSLISRKFYHMFMSKFKRNFVYKQNSRNLSK